MVGVGMLGVSLACSERHSDSEIRHIASGIRHIASGISMFGEA